MGCCQVPVVPADSRNAGAEHLLNGLFCSLLNHLVLDLR